MGVSTDALLVYGYIWDDDCELFENADEWAEKIAVQRGLTNPYDSFPDGLERLSHEERERRVDEWRNQHRAETNAWLEAKKAIENEFGVAITYHGSDEWRVPIVCIDPHFTAYRGYPVCLTNEQLKVPEDWNARLARFVAELAIDVSDAKGPAWWLCSWWG